VNVYIYQAALVCEDCGDKIKAGAVYTPAAVIEPEAGLIDQVTAVSAVNCAV